MNDLLAGYLGFLIGGILVLFWDNYKIREALERIEQMLEDKGEYDENNIH